MQKNILLWILILILTIATASAQTYDINFSSINKDIVMKLNFSVESGVIYDNAPYKWFNATLVGGAHAHNDSGREIVVFNNSMVDYATLTHNYSSQANVGANTNFTMVAVVESYASQQGGVLVEGTGSSPDWYYGVETNGGNSKARFFIRNSTSDDVSGGTITTNGGYYLLTAKREVGGNITLFINTGQVGTDTEGGYPLKDGPHITYIARGTGDKGFKGGLDWLGVWNRSLSNDEINGLWEYLVQNASQSLPNESETPTLPTLELIADNSETSANISNFNVTINGTTWTTTNGSIPTNITISNQLENITTVSQGFYDKSYTNMNISQAQILLNLTPQIDLLIYAHDLWDNTQVLTLNATINGTTYTTTNGTINTTILNRPTTILNITLTGLNKIDETILNYNASTGSLNQTMYETNITIRATAIYSNATILNYSIQTNQTGNLSTQNGNITIQPKKGVYTWNFSSPYNWHQTGLIFNITGSNTHTITNIADTYLRTVNNITPSIELTGTCTLNGTNYTSPLWMHVQSWDRTVNCTASGFQWQQETIPNATLPQNFTINITPAMLHLIFTAQTSGYITTLDNVTFFNDTTVFIQQNNITEGYVTVEFNPDGSGNYQQKFEYFNDNNTHIKQYIIIETPDLAQNVQVQGSGDLQENARVCAYAIGTNPDTSQEEWLLSYCDYTDINGIAELQVNDQNNYKICVTLDGYVPKCQQEFIPPSNTETITINLDLITSASAIHSVTNDCGLYFLNDSQCNVQIVTSQTANSICLNVTSLTTNTSTITCGQDSTQRTFSFLAETGNAPYNLSVLIDNTLYTFFTLNWANHTIINNVTWGQTPRNTTSILQRVTNNKTLLNAIYVIILILGLFVGYTTEKFFNNKGIYGTGITYMIFAVSGLPLFYIPAIIIAIHAIIYQILPMVKQ